MALTKRERKKMLREVGGAGIQNRIAEKVGKSPMAVSLVMNEKAHLLSKDTVREIQTAVAQELNQPVHEVWRRVA